MCVDCKCYTTVYQDLSIPGLGICRRFWNESPSDAVFELITFFKALALNIFHL